MNAGNKNPLTGASTTQSLTRAPILLSSSKPGLSYFEDDNRIGARVRDKHEHEYRRTLKQIQT